MPTADIFSLAFSTHGFSFFIPPIRLSKDVPVCTKIYRPDSQVERNTPSLFLRRNPTMLRPLSKNIASDLVM